MTCVPVPTALGVYETEQVVVAPEPDSAHGLVTKLPAPLEAQLTLPVGVLLPEARVTLTTQELLAP
jgi:hypothetical protein